MANGDSRYELIGMFAYNGQTAKEHGLGLDNIHTAVRESIYDSGAGNTDVHLEEMRVQVVPLKVSPNIQLAQDDMLVTYRFTGSEKSDVSVVAYQVVENLHPFIENGIGKHINQTIEPIENGGSRAAAEEGEHAARVSSHSSRSDGKAR
jgi:hypothetical protein